ncbi:MAG: hypothetical protein HN922_04655 [Anaerolineae bacterium]|nr:hypothetical protein [Anaerolineae bacterium]MBT7782358.1 hypothetical protein [Anaerolineae bacterium]
MIFPFLAYLLFCALSYLSEVDDILFGLVVMIGLGFPLAHAKWTGDWSSMGFLSTFVAGLVYAYILQ